MDYCGYRPYWRSAYPEAVKMNKRGGFSLLEILVTLVIISVGTLAIINWMPISIRTKANLEKRATTVFLAQGKIEEIKSTALVSFNNDFNQTAPASWSVPYDNFMWTASDDRGSAIKVISVSAWHREDPNNKVNFDTKIALR